MKEQAIQEQVDLCLQDFDALRAQEIYDKIARRTLSLLTIKESVRNIVTFACENAIDTQMTFFEERGSPIQMSAICFYGSDKNGAWIRCHLYVGLSSIVEEPTHIDLDENEEPDLENRVNELEKEVNQLRIKLAYENSVQNRKTEPSWSKIWDCPMMPSNQD